MARHKVRKKIECLICKKSHFKMPGDLQGFCSRDCEIVSRLKDEEIRVEGPVALKLLDAMIRYS